MVPIYRSDGEWVALYAKGYLFNSDGEWIGFVIGREVYDTAGIYLGFFSDDRRLLRKRNRPENIQRRKPPPRPARPKVPVSVPLAPMFKSLPHHIIDMFEAHPEKLMYVSETRPDMD